jgi:hypothetical protein
MALWKETEWDTFWLGNTNIEWNTHQVDPNLIEHFPMNTRTALEIGFGSGVNSQWMYHRCCQVDAIELSPFAVDKARNAYPGPNYLHQSILEDTGKTYDFLFDRAVYHMFIPEVERDTFIQSVYDKMDRNSLWLSIVILYGLGRTKDYNIQDAIRPLQNLFNVEYTIGSTNLNNNTEAAVIIKSTIK